MFQSKQWGALLATTSDKKQPAIIWLKGQSFSVIQDCGLFATKKLAEFDAILLSDNTLRPHANRRVVDKPGHC